MRNQDIDQIDIAMSQQRSFEGNNNKGLSSTPNYIQELEHKIDRLEYKINILLSRKR
jgi:hypothetical protein